MIKFKQQLIPVIAYILLMLLSIFFGISRLFIHPGDYAKDSRFAAKWDTNVAVIRNKIPSDTKSVGYISDLNLENATAQQQALERNELLLTRYSLAPVAVIPGLKPEWIIGNFTNPAYRNFLKENIKVPYTVDELGFGIFLIHKGK
jgi:hypothetical protein